MLSYNAPPKVWAATHFANLALGDRRLTRRAIYIAEHLAAHPGGTIPQLFSTWGDVKAAYRFFAKPTNTPMVLQEQHRRLVKQELQHAAVTLLIEDTSEFSWTGQEAIEGLGPIAKGDKGQQGFLLHSVLALRWAESVYVEAPRPPVALIGLADQQYHVRLPRPEGPKRVQARDGIERDRESALWEQATAHLGPAPLYGRWVRVCDRGADIYEFLQGCQAYGHGFVVRAAQDRVVVDERGRRLGRLFDRARAQTRLGQFELFLRARPGQKARSARIGVSAGSLHLRAPQRPGFKAGSLPALACTVVRAYEIDAPEGVKPLEWILLCDAVIESYQAALVCVLQYATRWIIEEFHKALKTGLRAKDLQLKQAQRLFAAMSLMSIVALRLLDLREQLRGGPEAPAPASGFTALELDVLSLRLNRSIATVRDVALAIGRLGGHLGRTRDGMPGWLTLWRGMDRLSYLVEGVNLAQQLSTYG